MCLPDCSDMGQYTDESATTIAQSPFILLDVQVTLDEIHFEWFEIK